MDERWTMLFGGAVALGGVLGLMVGWRRRTFGVVLNGMVAGVLVAAFWCALDEAFAPLHDAVAQAIDGLAGYWPVGRLFGGLTAGLSVGVGVLAGYEAWSRRAGLPSREELARGEIARLSVGRERSGHARRARWSPRRSMLVMATGSGLCALGAGLAVGSVVTSGQIVLAVLLTVAFALHLGSEAFTVVAPLTANGGRRWWLLLGMGLIGGAPALLGTFFGRWISPEADDVVGQTLGVGLLGLAAGILLYLVVRRIGVLAARGRPGSLYAGIGIGFFAAFLGNMALMVAVGVA